MINGLKTKKINHWRILKKLFLILLGFLLLWGFYIEPNMLQVKTLNFHNENLKGLKIAFVSDFHIKKHQKNRLTNIVKKIKAQNPDLILSTGDFVSGHLEKQSLGIEDITHELSKLKPKYGFYTTLGNHDWWQNGEKIEQVLSKNGIVVLGNQNTFIKINKTKLYIAGIEDMETRNIDITKALKNTKSPTILLSHSPDVFPIITNEQNSPLTKSIDLVLAGHTHGGQVKLPLFGALIVPSSYGQKYAEGLIVEKGKTMFVTKGIGTSILPVRFNCIPEIVVINFI